MNTTTRILDACRETACRALASASLLVRLGDLPGAIAAQPMAPLKLRGKSAPIEVFAPFAGWGGLYFAVCWLASKAAMRDRMCKLVG
jgi:hypothetical protein